MTDLSAKERAFLEDNIATVAFHLGRPGARLEVSLPGWNPTLSVDPGEVLQEISRRLTVVLAQSSREPAAWQRTWRDGDCSFTLGPRRPRAVDGTTLTPLYALPSTDREGK